MRAKRYVCVLSEFVDDFHDFARFVNKTLRPPLFLSWNVDDVVSVIFDAIQLFESDVKTGIPVVSFKSKFENPKRLGCAFICTYRLSCPPAVNVIYECTRHLVRTTFESFGCYKCYKKYENSLKWCLRCI